ncbi:hypothetical protein J3E72DRAFT_305950 [Bipolaris maydis]|uniref:uncharacterized protein n=1 Tax=Cochliobolus heterostrophus TaxID=5016 RepID=UPI0024D322DD|nr:hypothetical protein J3E73DRAFT_291904 [Bipolaris maydis]KAJ5063536.1 hypothetical protein J3E74DRAFT_318908 [Bipolaris maydis]KAJ6199795.1 hypothetical protein J3E72DRAFT_305950 [Bipolaris maydis]KAJ6205599.1 hypothetical protein PSV09DRAFT_2337681 [Bipolaris maydis]KAJ6272918.1 hypothetical protein PSV08DRAFT_283159 [Bipolaris maydis]
MGLGQVASRGFASTATLQVPNSSNTRGSAGSSSETLINQSSQERAPNYSHLRPSQPRPSSGGEDGEPRRRPIVISEEPSPVVRVSQYQSRASLTARSNFQELLSESDPGPSYPGDGDHLPAPPPLVDDSRDPDMDPAPGIVMNPSMPAHSNIPVGNLPPVQNSIGNLPQVQNSNVPARARTRVHGEPQTMQIDEHVQDPHGALSLCDCCEIPPEVLEWCGIAFESAIEACVIL